MRLGEREIGKGQPTYVIAEIGINHNGCMKQCAELIYSAAHCGADAVKFQKRNVDIVYTAKELARPRENPFGKTNGDLKRGLEFSLDQYEQIDSLCHGLGLDWSASCWDAGSVDDIESFDVPWHKIAGPCVTDDELVSAVAATRKPVLLSHGMSTLQEVDHAIGLLPHSVVPMHCVSSYPTLPADAQLWQLAKMRMRYGLVGYSGHEMGTAISIAAVAMGANVVERHFTISRELWGSDHKVSLEPSEFADMVKGIREVEAAMVGGGPRALYECERAAWEKLRRFKGGPEDCDSRESTGFDAARTV